MGTVRKKRGFSLVELLVVIALIALLAGILFPVFAAAGSQARQSSCASNLKQIGLALVQYAQDHDETMPPTRRNDTGTTTNPTRNTWYNLLQPYIKNTNVFRCAGALRTNASADAYYLPVRGYPVSYGYNNALHERNLATIETSSTLVLMTDIDTVPDATKDPADWPVKKGNAPWILEQGDFPAVNGDGTAHNEHTHFSAPSARHNSLCNVLWMDGHVKARKVQTFYTPGGKHPCLRPETGCF